MVWDGTFGLERSKNFKFERDNCVFGNRIKPSQDFHLPKVIFASIHFRRAWIDGLFLFNNCRLKSIFSFYFVFSSNRNLSLFYVRVWHSSTFLFVSREHLLNASLYLNGFYLWTCGNRFIDVILLLKPKRICLLAYVKKASQDT